MRRAVFASLSFSLLALLTIATRPSPASAFGSGCIGYCRYPTNAAKVFRWGNEAWDQEFEVGTLSRHWHSNHRHLIHQQGGMLTIEGTRTSGTVTAWPDNQAAEHGRWEARIRAVDKSTTGRQYRFTWELVPANGNDRCGANRVVLGSYSPGDRRVQGKVSTLPNHAFTYSYKRDLQSRAWHSYAIEITRHRISWFVDTKVLRTERRPAALSGVKYRPEFVMQAVRGTPMRYSWMQMDWVRYYTLQRPDAKSIAAPQMREKTQASAC